MNTSPSKNHYYTRVYAPILLGISIIFALFLLRPLYTAYLSKTTQLVSVEKNLAEKQASLDKLLEIQKAFATGSGSSDITQKVNKIDQKFDPSNIMSTIMLNDFTRSGVSGRPKISIASVSVDKGSKLPNGLSLGTASVSLSSSSVDDMIDFITYLTQSSSLAFTIDNISLPIDTTNSMSAGGVSLNIALGVYYFE